MPLRVCNISMTHKNEVPPNKTADRVIVVGTSAGGLEALIQLFAQLPEDFPIPVLVVQHISPDATGNRLLSILKRNTKLECVHAESGKPPIPGFIYLAPSDHHIMINSERKILVTKGAHENRSRPAIDPLFRSAAVAFGTGTIGILLTGYLDDGTAGMKVIQRCGGISIVQDPSDARYPDMPQNAINQIAVDFSVPISEMGGLLYRLLLEAPAKNKPLPKDIVIEAAIAERTLSDLPSVNALGHQVPFNCPGCGGVLWQVDKDDAVRYRCHTGHAYTAATLQAAQTSKIEETMWTALRMFEERKNLLTTMAKATKGVNSKSLLERAELSQVHIDRIRVILMADGKGTSDDMPA
jgi:two-component system chemotaxis response regulator CheB